MKPNHLLSSMLVVAALAVSSCSVPQMAQQTRNDDDVYGTKAQAVEYTAAPAPQYSQGVDNEYNDQDDYYGSNDEYADMSYSSRINRFYYGSPYRGYYDSFYGGYSPFYSGWNMGLGFGNPWYGGMGWGGYGAGFGYGWGGMGWGGFGMGGFYDPFSPWGYGGWGGLGWGGLGWGGLGWGYGGFYGGYYGGLWGGGFRSNSVYRPRGGRGSENGIYNNRVRSGYNGNGSRTYNASGNSAGYGGRGSRGRTGTYENGATGNRNPRTQSYTPQRSYTPQPSTGRSSGGFSGGGGGGGRMSGGRGGRGN